MKGGHAIETAMIGNDGAFGAAQALDDKVSLNKVTIQVPGSASAMDANVLPLIRLRTPRAGCRANSSVQSKADCGFATP
jgi:hypothetical protein